MVKLCDECDKWHFRRAEGTMPTVYVSPEASIYEPDLIAGRIGMLIIWN